MLFWEAQEPTGREWRALVDVLAEEVEASRRLQALLTENRLRAREKFRLLHRRLRLDIPIVEVPDVDMAEDVNAEVTKNYQMV
jgi:hypothetical protein